MQFSHLLQKTLQRTSFVHTNPSREKLITMSLERKECVSLPCGALATWTPAESTGRRPQDTYIVKQSESELKIDWSSPNCIPLDPESFSMIFHDAVEELSRQKELIVLDRVLGADSRYALPVQLVTYHALSGVFADNMFRAVPEDIQRSVFANRPFTLLALPYSKLNPERYRGRLRKLADGSTSNMAVVMDFDNRIGIVYGSAYLGSIKKLMFTVMNYYLPDYNILPLHCSANEGKDGRSAVLLGLSGTGKTTLSADPERALLGDDEHAWSEDGIANFENGCYAKLINLNAEKEPEIYRAIFHADLPTRHGAIIENAMVYPDGSIDLNDARLAENSRASFPLSFLRNIKESSVSGHPSTILFLTADAYGVLPPIAKLTPEQAMFWFMMGYTSKLAGTEIGVCEPKATFSRFFGAPFMPRHPADYTTLLGEKLKKHKVNVYLVNTGWSGGPYGIGKRMDINLTRAMVRAALDGTLEQGEYIQDPIFKVFIPQSCPHVPSTILNPKNTWQSAEAFENQARKLAQEFAKHFQTSFAGKVSKEIENQCPGI